MTKCIKIIAMLSKIILFELTKYIVSNFPYHRYHPQYKNIMQSRISQLMGIDYKFNLMLSEDGSGRGAALVAAVLKRGE